MPTPMNTNCHTSKLCFQLAFTIASWGWSVSVRYWGRLPLSTTVRQAMVSCCLGMNGRRCALTWHPVAHISRLRRRQDTATQSTIRWPAIQIIDNINDKFQSDSTNQSIRTQNLWPSEKTELNQIMILLFNTDNTTMPCEKQITQNVKVLETSCSITKLQWIDDKTEKLTQKKFIN